MADQTVTVSTGVVFRLTNPSIMAVQAVERQMAADEPKPPKVWIEAKGREEVNDQDPGYRSAMQRWQGAIVERQYDVVVATGTEIVSVPDDIPSLDDDEWVERIEAIGITPAAGKTARKIQWVKFIAAPSLKDMQSLLQPLFQRMGVGEQEVAEAVETFRGLPGRGADPGADAAGGDPDGDRVPAAVAGAGPALRGVGRNGYEPA